MKLYDLINNEQIYCFMQITYARQIEKNNLQEFYYHFNNQDFNIKDKVPYRSYAYNYTKNFIIINGNINSNNKQNEHDFCAHIIKDGIIIDNCYNLNNLHLYLTPDTLIIDEYGTALKIHSLKQLTEYIRDLNECKDKANKVIQRANYLERKEQQYVQELKTISIYSTEYKKLEKDIERVRKERISAQRKDTKIANEIFNNFSQKWKNHKLFEEEKIFGAYIECYKYFLLENEDVQETEDFVYYKTNFKIFMEEHSYVYDKYIMWNPPLTEMEENYIYNIIKTVLNDSQRKISPIERE